MKYGDAEVESLGKALAKTLERETALRERAEKAEARVKVLEAECRAWQKAEDWLVWDIGEPDDCAASKRELDEAQRRLDAARAATGPLDPEKDNKQ